MLEVCSVLGNEIINAVPEAYQLLVVKGAAPAGAHQLLDGVKAEQLLAVQSGSLAAAHGMLAGLWLWHDELVESHRIVQKSPGDLPGASIENQKQLEEWTATFAYWHAIIHRREGDFSNSKYWLARCRGHAVFARIAGELPGVIEKSGPGAARLTMGGWNPGAMVDLVEQVHDRRDDPLHSTAVAVQRLEWKSLFAYCAQQAGEPAPE
jgi:hypothetical protein